jgi:hypothetical protein
MRFARYMRSAQTGFSDSIGGGLSWSLVAIAFVLNALIPDVALADSKVLTTSAIELKNNESPASDLLLKGQPLDADHAADLRRQGQDLSRLNPVANDVWSNAKLSAVEHEAGFYPSEKKPPLIEFKSIIPLNPEGWFRTQVQGVGEDGKVRLFRMMLSLNTHQALMRAALLRKLGYPIQSPRWFPQVQVKFASADERKKIVSEIAIQAGLVDSKRWVLSENESEQTVLLQDVMLEPAAINVPTSFYMGNLLATHIKGRRTMRALLVPFTLLDVPESVNMYAWEAAQLINESLIFTHKYADAFQETTLDDVLWVIERLASLTRDDWREIVNAGRYPQDIEAVIYEKTLARRNNLIAYAKIQSRLRPDLVKFEYNKNITIGSVQNGKVTQERYEGYALRFTHGDPESPLRTDDIVRFLKIEAKSSSIRQLTAMVNQKLEMFPMDKLLQERSENLRRQFFDHFQSNPTKPFAQPVSTWGGLIGGVSVNASRSIVTGSYFGDQSSDFKVSLVDQVSAGARVGYFLGVDGFPKVFPGLGANLSVIRSYVHVRPIPSMEAAEKKSWSDLFVPNFLKNLGSILSPSLSEKVESRQKEMSDNITKFLDELKEGESFTITDTLAIGENASLTIPITTLLGLDPVSYASTIVLGASSNQVVLRRTTFNRENGFIKIYLQNIQSQMAGVSLDVNLWMNIMRLSFEKKWGQARTRAFHLDEKPKEEKQVSNTVLAIRGILASNNSEILEANFHPYVLNHRTQSDISQGKFLFWRWTNIEEWHRVKVRPPTDPDRDFDPKKFERTLFSHRILQRSGKNYYSFLADVLDGLVQNSKFWRPGLLAGGGGSNPKDSFFGSSRWTVTTTEAEVTKDREGNPVTTVENFWAGWDLSKQELFRTIDEIDQRVQGLGLGLPLVNRDMFHDMRKLQLYEVRTTLIVYEKGMETLRQRLLVRNGDRGTALKRVFGWDKFSGTDKEIVEKILIPLYGAKRFEDWCFTQRQGGEADRSTEIGFKGESYKCLMPWMWEVLELRRAYPSNKEERIKWATRMITHLERHLDLAKLMSFIGRDNLFFQIKISGFRTRDENGDTADYRSSTVGTYSTKDRAGVFKDFTTDYRITSSEMNASYLSEGF